MLKTLLVEDNDALRRAMKTGLEATGEAQIAGEVASGETMALIRFIAEGNFPALTPAERYEILAMAPPKKHAAGDWDRLARAAIDAGKLREALVLARLVVDEDELRERRDVPGVERKHAVQIALGCGVVGGEEPAAAEAPEPHVPARTRRRWLTRLLSAAALLVTVLASTEQPGMIAVCGAVGLQASRAELVREYAARFKPARGERLVRLAALSHRLVPGVRLM